MSLARITVRRPVATLMVALGVFLFGLLSLQRVPLDLLPDLSYPAKGTSISRVVFTNWVKRST